MDFHVLAAAHLPLQHRRKPDPAGEDRYYHACPDLATIPPRVRALLAVILGALAVLFLTLGSA
jgi:hypothetical protein